MITMKIDEVLVQGAPQCKCGSTYWTYYADGDELVCSSCNDVWYGDTEESQKILEKLRQVTTTFGVDLD